MKTAKACSVPMILAALAVLLCVFLVHAAAAAAATTTNTVGYRRALLPRDEEAVMPVTAEEAAVGMAGVVEGELPAFAAGEEEIVRRMDMQTQDYPGSGANSRHDPRNPH